MKAVKCSKYGPPEVLQFVEIEKPTPKDNEVLIKVHATSVTVADCRVRGFNVPLSFWLPARIALGFWKPKIDILGEELAGEIEYIGKNVTLFKKGDKVFAFPGHSSFGCYTEYKCMPENAVIAIKPSSICYEEATAIPFGGGTALHFMRKANIQCGQKILIYGASGSVGTYAVQLAKCFGAEVTGVCSTTNLKMVESLGTDKVIDYTKEDFSKKGEKYDVIFDAVGKSTLSACVKSLKENGTLIQAVATPALSIRMKLLSLLSKKKFIGGTLVPKTEDLIYLINLVEKGMIKPVIDRKYTFEEIVEAHKYVDKGHKKGNVVITL
ncbi:MAG: NAD(P)-dependent alcohol dehydrogenase [Paludibacter sp.]